MGLMGMKGRLVLLIGVILAISTIAFAIDSTPPISTIKIDTNSTNNSSWFNDKVIASIDASDEQSEVSSTWYCVDLTNSCTPNTIYTTPIEINTEGKNYLRYLSTNEYDINEIAKSKEVFIDKTAPTLGTIFFNGGYFDVAARTIDFNYGQIMAAVGASDSLSGITTCQFNFDYNVLNPTVGWSKPNTKYALPNFVTGEFTTLGNKIVAAKCADDANNFSVVLTSTPPFTIRANGFYIINSMTVVPSIISLDKNVAIDLNVSDNNGTKSIEIEFTNGTFSKIFTATKVTDGTYNLIVTPDTNWPVGPLSVITKITDLANGIRYRTIDTNTIDVYDTNLLIVPSSVTAGNSVTISGKVNSLTGRVTPISPVIVSSGLGVFSTTTDVNGFFSITFNAPTAGTYSMDVNFAGTRTTTSNVTSLIVNAVPVAPVNGGGGGGGWGTYVPRPVDTNKPVDTNQINDVNANTRTDLNNSLSDINANTNITPPFDLNALTPTGEIDNNLQVSDSNTPNALSIASGLFGFLGNSNGATESSWALPLLIVLLALVLGLLGIVMQNNSNANALSGKKWIKK